MNRLWLSRRALVRAVAWQPACGAAVASAVVVELSLRFGAPHAAVVHRFQLVVLTAAAFVAFALDDEAEATMASSPTSLARRRLHRLALVLPIVTAAWVVAAGRAGLLGTAWSAMGQLFAVEALAYAAVALAITALLMRAGHGGHAAVAGSLVALVLAFVGALVPWPWSPLPPSPLAPGAGARLLTVIGAAALLAARASRDPTHR